MKFSPASIQALKAADPRIKRLPHAALIACLAAIEREADATACSCNNAWFPEREAGQPTGPLKILKVTHS